MEKLDRDIATVIDQVPREKKPGGALCSKGHAPADPKCEVCRQTARSRDVHDLIPQDLPTVAVDANDIDWSRAAPGLRAIGARNVAEQLATRIQL